MLHEEFGGSNHKRFEFQCGVDVGRGGEIEQLSAPSSLFASPPSTPLLLAPTLSTVEGRVSEGEQV